MHKIPHDLDDTTNAAPASMQEAIDDIKANGTTIVTSTQMMLSVQAMMLALGVEVSVTKCGSWWAITAWERRAVCG